MNLNILRPLEAQTSSARERLPCGQVRDLTPLKGMPLTWLSLHGCGQVRDLTPLQGMNLTGILLNPRTITKGMSALRQMKSLKTIQYGSEKFTPEEFWKKYNAGEFK